MKKFFKSSKGLSAIISVVIMILLVLVVSGIVWGVVNGIIRDKTEGVKSCLDVSFSEAIVLVGDYTCYDSENSRVQFSIGIGDVEISGLLISISGVADSTGYVLKNEAESISGLKNYDGTDKVKLPGRNAGLTYFAEGFSQEPDFIKIAPIVNEKQCEVSDTIYEFEDCSFLIN